ncbi:MAG TPA: hypothetical protein VHI13_10685 [Candidatus Kapabacteria bacterium]|nr:hypothetical protein [Candidatus Kapabacteria bacterium]
MNNSDRRSTPRRPGTIRFAGRKQRISGAARPGYRSAIVRTMMVHTMMVRSAMVCAAIAFILPLRTAQAQTNAPESRDHFFFPFIFGYHMTFGADGIGGHHLNIGLGMIGNRGLHDTTVVDLVPALIGTATVEVGYSKGKLVFAPMISGYLAGGLALGFNVGLLTDGREFRALVRPLFGVGLAPENDGFALTYGYTLTIPWGQEMIARSTGAIDLMKGAWRRPQNP